MRLAADDADDEAQTHCSAPTRKRTPYTQAIALAAGA